MGAAREALTDALDRSPRRAARRRRAAALVHDRLDLTLGGRGYRRGHLHPVTRIWRELEDVFVGLGYTVAEGPEVETDWYNFEALNFPPGHPARAMQDTLYVKLGKPEEVMLRTHTSPVQVRADGDAPRRRSTWWRPAARSAATRSTRAIRRCSTRSSASPSTAASRSATCWARSRRSSTRCSAPTSARASTPSFFPFTEPSAEFSITCVFCDGAGCRVCSRTGWIELGGCGMVDPNVFEAVGIDPEEYTGFAFGFGIDRIVQLLYGVDHVKNLWDGDVRFAAQF